MNKRGLAPLIATVILIVLAVGLGVVVMNFGRAQIEEAAQCPVKIGLRMIELNEQPQACLDKANNQIYFIVENGASIGIESMRFRAIGSEAILATDVPDKIERLGTLMKYVPYEYSKYGNVLQLKLTPEVSLYGEKAFCDEQALVVENVRECAK